MHFIAVYFCFLDHKMQQKDGFSYLSAFVSPYTAVTLHDGHSVCRHIISANVFFFSQIFPESRLMAFKYHIVKLKQYVLCLRQPSVSLLNLFHRQTYCAGISGTKMADVMQVLSAVPKPLRTCMITVTFSARLPQM